MERCVKFLYCIIAASLLSFCSTIEPVPTPKQPELMQVNTLFGRDFYALQSQYWDIKSSNSYPMPLMATGNLDNTFGSDMEHVVSTLSVLHPFYHRVHIINATCIRNGNCGKYEVGYGYNKKTFDEAIKAHNKKILNYLKSRVSVYSDLQVKFPTTRFVVSPVLEHDLSIESWKILADTTLEIWPEVQLANSPDGGISAIKYKGAWIERHGKDFPMDADIVSLDGFDVTDIDSVAFRDRVLRAPNLKMAFSWTLGDNCRVKGWIDPRMRKNCPSSDTFELISHIMEAVPQAPKFAGKQCKKMSAFKSPDIWKPLAESYANSKDSRQELPVLIAGGFKKANVNLLSSNGGQIGTLGFYGSFGKQLRWYSGYKKGSHLSGYEFQKRANASSGNPYIWMIQAGSCKGPFVPGRRGGATR